MTEAKLDGAKLDGNKAMNELRNHQGCQLLQELKGVPFEEQVKILRGAEAAAEKDSAGPSITVDTTASGEFRTSISAGRTDSRWLGLFFRPKGYTANLDLDTGEIRTACY